MNIPGSHNSNSGANPKALNEQDVSALVSEYLTSGVPEDADVWSQVRTRLNARMAGVGQPAEQWNPGGAGAGRVELPRIQHKVPPGTIGTPPESVQHRIVPGLRNVYSSTRGLAIVGLFALLGVMMLLAISGLSRHTAVSVPSVSQNAIFKPCAASECELLFSVPLGKGNPEWGFGGFGVADDGSFWLGEAGSFPSASADAQGVSGRLLHYTPNGKLLSIFNVGSESRVLSDLEVQGSTVYALVGDVVYTYTPDGSLIAAYNPILRFPGSQIARLERYALWPGTGGVMLIEEAYSGTYMKVQNVNLNSDINSLTIHGYPAGDMLYAPGQSSDVIMAGSTAIKIELPGTVRRWHILRVLEDGAFYVAVETGADRVPNVPNGVYNYILHFGRQGQLLEHLRLPAVWFGDALVEQLAMGVDNSIYAMFTGLEYSTSEPSSQANIVRLRMLPASEALPPLPTPTQTVIMPPPVPTIMSEPPDPVATADAALTAWAEAALVTPTVPPTPQPTPTTISDLTTLAQQAQGIAYVRMEGASSATQAFIVHVHVEKWLKQPDDASGELTVWIPYTDNPGNSGAGLLQSFWDPSVKEYILFLNRRVSAQPSELVSYDLSDRIAGVFSARDGRIEYAGLLGYKDWPSAQFEEAVRSALREPPSKKAP